MDQEATKVIQQIANETDFFNKAKLIRFLIRQKQIKAKNIGKLLQIKPSYLSHILRLNKIPAIVVDGYYSKLITLSHLFIISRLETEEEMIRVYEKILTDSLTVLGTEEEVREIKYKVKTLGSYLSSKEKALFAEEFKKNSKNTDIKIIQTRLKSKVIIEINGALNETTKAVKNILDKIL